MPDLTKPVNYIIWPSPVNGNGAFVTIYIKQNQLIGTCIIYILYLILYITYFGSKINHSSRPSYRVAYDKDQNVWPIVANYDIVRGTEITIDYNLRLRFIRGSGKDFVRSKPSVIYFDFTLTLLQSNMSYLICQCM